MAFIRDKTITLGWAAIHKACKCCSSLTHHQFLTSSITMTMKENAEVQVDPVDERKVGIVDLLSANLSTYKELDEGMELSEG